MCIDSFPRSKEGKDVATQKRNLAIFYCNLLIFQNIGCCGL
jgi:hypothetical protein